MNFSAITSVLQPRSLKAKMILFGFLISIIPLGIYQFITLNRSADILMNTYAQELRHKTELTAMLIDQAIAHNISEIKTLSRTIVVQDNKKLGSFLKELADFRNDIASITLLDQQGNLIVSSSPYHRQLKDTRHFPWPIQQLFDSLRKNETGGVYISEAINTPEGTHIYLMTRTASDDPKQPTYLMIEMGLSNIALLLSDFEDEIEGQKHAYLVDRDGRVILTQDTAYPLFSRFLDMAAIEAKDQFRVKTTNMFYTDCHGDRVIPSVETISRFGINEALGWHLVSFVPTEQITAGVFASLKMMIWIGIVIILLALLIAYLMAQDIIRPVNNMVSMAKLMQKGDYSARIDTNQNADSEMTTLALTLNSMAGRIEEHTSRLEEKSKFIHFILDATPVFTVTVKDREVEYVNKTFLNFLGFANMREFNDKKAHLCRYIYQIDKVLILNQRDEEIQALLTASHDQQIVYFKNEKGEISSPYINTFACFEQDTKCIFTFTDVTRIESQKSALQDKIVKAEEERQKQQQLMEIQARQAQMGEMIGSIAHQWKQPLNLLSISAFDITEIYRAGDLTDESMNAYLQNLQNTIRYMSSTIDDFRNFFQPTSTMLPFSPARAIDHILRMIGKIYKLQNIDIRISSQSDIEVLGIQNEFQQVILNLLNNAKDAFIEKQITQREIDIRITQSEKLVNIAVEDNAGGIPESFLDKIFDSYFSTKDAAKGTGIGLYMSKQIIEEKMGGRLNVTNTENGACFTISLPKTSL